MENLSIIKSQNTNDELYAMEAPLIEKYEKEGYRNPSLTLHGSMVWGFANHLPYSMDIEQPEYVPGDFLNIEPKDVDENIWFKWEDRRTIYNAMYCWGDTRRSGILLQTCYVFQQMLLGNISPYVAVDEDSYYSLGINKFTGDEEYNKRFFSILKKLPEYYERVVTAENNTKRREALEEIYKEIRANIEMKIGGFAEHNSDGTLRRYSPATVSCPPYMDVEMLIDSSRTLTYFDGLELDLTKNIKAEQLQRIHRKVGDKEKTIVKKGDFRLE